MTGDEMASVNRVLDAFKAEYVRARGKYAPMHSAHEGYAVLKEEVDELWDEIKADSDPVNKRKEAIQVGAMALAFVLEAAGK